jgi:ABC-type transport system involved in cytochrome bd biosynthesis fused ATPase/permease subunit
MNYNTYLIGKLKYLALQITGLIFMFMGLISMIGSMTFGLILFFIGLIFFIIGIYLKNKFYYNREEHRAVYVRKGRYN